MKRTTFALLSIFLFLLPFVGSNAKNSRSGRSRQSASSGTAMWV